MATIPESPHTTHAQIVKWYESKPQEHRPHMGASLIGSNCDRYIWLTWRWALKPEFPGRILRLFNTGVREEARLIEELRGIGVTVWDTDPNTGEQWRVSTHNGHFGGSLDGVAKGVPEAPKTPCVLEFKTHSEKSWKEVASKGVQKAKSQHYDQMQVYMGLMDLERALYMAVNKNTDDIYTEWVHFDKDRFTALLERAKRLIESPTPPYRISTDAENFECKYCSMWRHCHGGQAAEANCRTCSFASPVENGAWRCEKNNGNMDIKIQRDGCGQHLFIPDLIPYADAQDGGETWVAYRHKETGDHFTNGIEAINEYGPVFSSKEIHNVNGSLMADLIKHKNEIPGSRVVSGETYQNKSFHEALEAMSTHPDDLKSKPDNQAQKNERKKIAAAVKAIKEMK